MDGAPLAETGAGGLGMAQLALLILVVLVAVASPILVRIARRRKEKELASPAEERDAARRVRLAADKAMVELLEAGREITAQVDTKIRVLNKLVKDARDQADRLERLTGVSTTPGESDASGGASPAETDAGERSVPAVSAGNDNGKGGSASATRSARRRTRIQERISSLHRQGCDAAQIARITHLSVAEINLALRLHAADEERPSGKATA